VKLISKSALLFVASNSVLACALGKPFVAYQKPAISPQPVQPTPAPEMVSIDAKVIGPGEIDSSNSSSVCVGTKSCLFEFNKGSQGQFEAIWDGSTGLQFLGFSGCDAIEAEGTICTFLATTGKIIGAKFSTPPSVSMISQDNSSFVYLSAYNSSGEPTITDSDTPITEMTVTASSGSSVTCTLNGDKSMVVDDMKCIAGGSNYYFSFDVDPALTSLSVTTVVTNSEGLSATFKQLIR